jgi:molecular chaperone IbpA
MTRLLKPASSWELDPFDLLWKNIFEDNTKFNTLVDKINYPVDIYEEENGITFELAVVGLDKEDIQIQVQGENFRIKYDRPQADERAHIYKGIARRSFDLSWKISTKFDLTKLEASMDRGLLKINIPLSEEKKPKLVEIKTIK